MTTVKSLLMAATAFALGSSIAGAATPASGNPAGLLAISADAAQLAACGTVGVVGQECKQQEQICRWVNGEVSGVALACKGKTGGWVWGGVGLALSAAALAALGGSGGTSSP